MRHPAEVARQSAGIQSQDPAAGRLGFRVRSARLAAADIDRARTEERSLLRTWAMRSTAHTIAADDAGWLLPLFDRALATASRRRLAQLGLDAAVQERALRAIEAALRSDGYLGRSELVGRLAGLGIEIDAARRVHLFRAAVAEGIACLGPDRGGETLLALAGAWLGKRANPDRAASLRELARRYLRAFAPATDSDFAGWSGLGLGDVRAALAGIGDELVEVRIGPQRGWALKRPARRARRGTVRLLPAFDNYLMGHRDRDFIAAGDQWRQIMPGGGLLRPTILVDGVAVGTWGMRRAGGRLEVTLAPFRPLDNETLRAIEDEIEDISRFEGLPASFSASSVE